MENVLRITKENKEARTNGGVLMVGRIMNKREVEEINRETTSTISTNRFNDVVRFMHMADSAVKTPVIEKVVAEDETIDTSMFAIINEHSRKEKELNNRRVSRQSKINKKEGILSYIKRIVAEINII